MSLEKPKRRKRNYINNKELYEHMVEWRKAMKEAAAQGKPRPQVPRYVAEAIMLISENLSTKFSYVKYSYRDEMVADAILNAVRYVHNFDPEKSKYPFAYISRMVNRTFYQRIEFEQKQQYAMLANSQRYLILDQLNPDQIMGEGVELYDNLLDFIENFEDKHERKAHKKKVRRKPKPEKVSDEFWA